ncbi:hypothetical protein NA78x_000738 [Anatilimnocola sp. NA78]|uniref:hypothetical protein n=1 Tax=Anatilimnocola sp. NA78 TaxID=3415683 RepID=UPI003CE46FF4
MSKKKKTQSIFRAPKPRDLEIYERCSTHGVSQRMVAAEFGISQPAVSKICHKLQRWEGEPELTTNRETEHKSEQGRIQRLHMLTRQHKRRLDMGYSQMCEKWRASQEPQFNAKKRKFKGDLMVETSSKTRDGNPRFLNDAIRMSEKMLKFEGIKLDGTVDFETKNRLPEEPEMTYDERMAEQRRWIDAALPEVEKWEAKEREKERQKEERRMQNEGKLEEVAAVFGPSPLYSGERAGVRGERCESGLGSQESWRASNAMLPAASAKAVEPPGQARGRKEETRGQEDGFSTSESGYQTVITEGGKTPEITAMKSCEVVETIEDSDDVVIAEIIDEKVIKTVPTPSPRYSGERAGVRGDRWESGLGSEESLRVGNAMLPAGSAKAVEPPGQARGREEERRGRMGEGRGQERSDATISPSPALPHSPSSSCPTTEFLRSTAPAFTTERHPSAVEKFTPKPGSAFSVDARGRLVQEAEGFRRLVPTNWIEPPPSKFPVQTVEECF